MKDAALTLERFIAQVGIECDQYKVPIEAVLDEYLVVRVREGDLTRAPDAVSTSVKEIHNRLDHVLVGQEL